MGFKTKTWDDNNPPTLDASDLNGFKSEFNNTYIATGQTPDNGDLQQTATAMSIATAGSDYYVDSGIADNYVLSPTGAFLAPIVYFIGMRIRFIPNNTNTGASTINVASLGVVNIKNLGNDLEPSQLRAGEISEFYFDGTDFVKTYIADKGLLIIDKKRFTTGTVGIPSGGAFQRQLEVEVDNDYNWPLNQLFNRVRLRVNFVGSASNPSVVTLRIQEGGAPNTILWEQTGIEVTNPGITQEEHNFFNFDLNNANSVSLDMSVTELKNINGPQTGNNWELFGAMTAGAGNLFIRDLEFQWLL